MKRSRYICAATKNGAINILDSSFGVLRTWNAHAALINDMDAQHDFIVTCGYSLRQQQSLMLDPLVNVFDLKNMQSLPPFHSPQGLLMFACIQRCLLQRSSYLNWAKCTL